MRDVLALVVSGLLGGGLIAGIASLVTARGVASKNRAETKAITDKAPAEVDSITVQGAEQAVLSMERSMQAAEKRAERAEERIKVLEDEREEDHRKISALQEQLLEVSAQAEHAEQAAAAAREQASGLQRQLTQMQQTYERRTNGGA